MQRLPQVIKHPDGVRHGVPSPFRLQFGAAPSALRSTSVQGTTAPGTSAQGTAAQGTGASQGTAGYVHSYVQSATVGELGASVQIAIDSATRVSEITVVPYGPAFWQDCPHPTCWNCRGKGLTSYFGTAGFSDLHEYFTISGTGAVIGHRLRCARPECNLETNSFADPARPARSRLLCRLRCISCVPAEHPAAAPGPA